MAELDYYKILGVPSSSSDSQIKKRYQELAKEHHPDHQGDETSMVVINRAYEVLSNSSKRIEYDQLRRSQKRRTAANGTRPGTHTNWSKTNRKAEATYRDKIVVAVFLVILLVTMLGFH